MANLTLKTVKALKSDGRDVVYWDDEKGRFGLRITAMGIKSYVIQYRNAQGRSRRLTIGATDRHGFRIKQGQELLNCCVKWMKAVIQPKAKGRIEKKLALHLPHSALTLLIF